MRYGLRRWGSHVSDVLEWVWGCLPIPALPAGAAHHGAGRSAATAGCKGKDLGWGQSSLYHQGLGGHTVPMLGTASSGRERRTPMASAAAALGPPRAKVEAR
jgi:hypothetical protein